MKIEQLTEALVKYRQNQARAAYLRSQLETLNRFLERFTGSMINDQVSMSQAITGMPHGSNPGDPVGRLAVDIASGKVSEFVAQIRGEIRETQDELSIVQSRVSVADLVLNALTEKERQVVTMKLIDDLSWAEILSKVRRTTGQQSSKRTLQRALSDALEKGAAIVK